ncbi:MAG: hypothetical protein NT171_15820 [Planctomycetota bacterium]|nr:hypothetical protein [Planctomycetota bacterium]
MLPRIVFHHVHKCAGTTLLKFLEGTTTHERAVHVEELVAGQGGDPNGTEARAAILRAEFLHDPYGVHDWKGLLGNAVDVIFLRDPVARLHSEWRMITRWDDALVSGRDERYRRLRAVAREGFAPFLALPGAAVFGNAVAHHLAFGEPVLAELQAACRSADPASALFDLLEARLAAIDVVGFVEEFEDFLAELVARLGCSPPRGSLQVHNKFATSASLTAEERRLAESCTVIDRRLVAGARDSAPSRRRGDRRALDAEACRGYRARILAPPAAVLVDMGEGFLGTGWHPCEINGRKRARWTGPCSVASLDVRIDRSRALRIRLRVGNHLRSTQVDGLRIVIDGQPCQVDHWVLPPFDHFFEAAIPVAPGSLPWLHVEIDCLDTFSPTDAADTRRLGVEIEEIEIGPAERFVPRSLAALGRVQEELSRLATTPDGDRRMQVLLESLPAGAGD